MKRDRERSAGMCTGRLFRGLQVVLLSMSLHTSATFGAAQRSVVGLGMQSAARSAETGPAAACAPGALIRGAQECASANKDRPDLNIQETTDAATTIVMGDKAKRIAISTKKKEDGDLDTCPADLGTQHPDIASCLEKCGDAKESCNEAAKKLAETYRLCQDEVNHEYDACVDADKRKWKKQACAEEQALALARCTTILGAQGVATISCGAAAAACATGCVGGSAIKACWGIFK